MANRHDPGHPDAMSKNITQRELRKVDVAQFFVNLDRYAAPDPLRDPGEPERPV